MVKDMFAPAQLVSDPIEVDCTLSGGAETTCIQITVIPEPATYDAGPWCPTNVNDGPENAGIWFYDGEVVDADGAFFQSLAVLYDDDTGRSLTLTPATLITPQLWKPAKPPRVLMLRKNTRTTACSV